MILKRGDRVRITGPMRDPDPIPVGTEGVVTTVMNQATSMEQICVDWEIEPRRSLMLLPGDPFEVVPPPKPARSRRTTSPSPDEG